jgi:hypothetical protein
LKQKSQSDGNAEVGDGNHPEASSQANQRIASNKRRLWMVLVLSFLVIGAALGAWKYSGNIMKKDLNGTQAANTTNNATQAEFINIAGGIRLELDVKDTSQSAVIGKLKDRAAQLGYKNTTIYPEGGDIICLDIIGEIINANQVKDLINIQPPVELLSSEMIPPQSDENNQPDQINIVGGLRVISQTRDQTVSIEEVIRSLRERAAQLGYGGVVFYQLGNDRVVMDEWDGSYDPKDPINNQVNIIAIQKTIIPKQS